MPMSFPYQNKETCPDELVDVVRSSPALDRNLAMKIGKCIAVRRELCGLSKQQLAVRLGIATGDVDAYEQGLKRINSRLLLETAKLLKARPRFFFQ
jgi:DNA-binding transcriptional regulator YiaG